MPYSYIASVLVFVVVLRFVVAGETRAGTKVLVVALYSASVVFQYGFPQWQFAVLSIQGLLGIGLLLYSKLAMPEPASWR